MGFYHDRFIPWAIHHVMRNRQATGLRRTVVPGATGRVLEIGIGSGLNLPFYGSAVARLTGLDPSPALLARARAAAGRASVAIELVEDTAEALPFAPASFDTVVSTWSLCSIPDIARALAEVRRVLEPGGRFLFIEHGRAPEPAVARWQRRVNPLWRGLSGGCNLDRDIPGLVAAAGLRSESLEQGYMVSGPRLFSYHFRGRARPS